MCILLNLPEISHRSWLGSKYKPNKCLLDWLEMTKLKGKHKKCSSDLTKWI